MSNVVKASRRPVSLRAVIHLSLGCVLLAGCSASSERFSTFSLDSGYEPAPASNKVPAPSPKATAYNAPAASPAAYQPRPAPDIQLASATVDQSGSFGQASRADLPPLPVRPSTPGTKLADGYGPYNPPPVSDGVYTGPRVYTPYDSPKGEVPPREAYPGDGDPRRFDRGAAREAPPPSDFYRAPNSDAEVYEPKSGSAFHDEARGDGGRGWDRQGEDRDAAGRHPFYGPEDGGRDSANRVVVAPGETLYTLARRWGVTVDMIARANRLTTPYVRPGAVLLIPRADPTAYGRASASAEDARGSACADAHCHVVRPGDTIVGIARAHNITGKQLAEANNLTGSALKPGQKLILPAQGLPSRQALAGRQDRPAPAVSQAQKAPASSLADASPKPADAASARQPSPVPLSRAPEVRSAELVPVPELSCDAQLANPLPRMGATFRKPVEGKTIAQFGPQKDGTVNEGVTISVPKGTPIKAAENGVVAYAGDELPGFGNLILIRHADEYITAYAHADSIAVKKCEVVKRGQIVGTAGTTGDASQPQLHFEIRKNSKPVDPVPLMGS